MFKKILITGITGFVGSHLAEYILKKHKDIKVYGLVRWRSPKNNILNVLDKITLSYGDLEDYSSLEKILSDVKPDVIFHLAAQSYVDFSFISPIATLNANVIGTANLLESIQALKLQVGYDPIIHICSSSEVYGQVKEDEIPIKETNPLRPASPYAVSKVGEDMLALQYFLSWNVKTIRTRMFTHEGPRRGEVFAPSNFAKQIAAIEIGKQKPVVMVGNLNSVRTFMDVRDAVKAYWLLVNKCTFGEVYNIGGVETMTIGDMLNKLISFSKKKNIEIKIDPKRLRPSDVTLQIPSVEKFVKQTGWKPNIKFDQTLKDMLDYWRDYYKKNL
ncbi:MAG: GDP-mannose 4,6-dehydratase [bacterium]|nr:GDP-mannose 4,6-dehydratase [bacterium]